MTETHKAICYDDEGRLECCCELRRRETTIIVKVSRHDAQGKTGVEVARRVDAYLPANYAVAYSGPNPDGSVTVTVKGIDSAGWTAEGYVIPRLASGLYAAEVVKDEQPTTKGSNP